MKNLNQLFFIFVFSFPFSSIHAQGQIWKELCQSQELDQQTQLLIPTPNYQNSLIQNVLKKLDQVHSDSFYLYSDIEKVYGLCDSYSLKAEKCLRSPFQPENIQTKSHNFLVIACGEYRDNELMLQKKLEWISKMNIVQDGKQSYTESKGVWEQLTSQGYLSLLEFSQKLYQFREQNFKPETSSIFKESVSAISACEYRFILKEYLSANKKLKTYEDYKFYVLNFRVFSRANSCTQEEDEYYYEFRGDGNFKPHSLESNAYIWNTRTFSKNCSNLVKSKKNSSLKDIDCEDYYTSPFKAREKLAKQGLLRLFLYPEDLAPYMRDYDHQLVFIVDDLNGDQVSEMITLQNLDNGQNNPLLKAREEIQESRKAKHFFRAQVYTELLMYIVFKSVLEFPLEENLKTFEANIEKHKESLLKTLEYQSNPPLEDNSFLNPKELLADDYLFIQKTLSREQFPEVHISSNLYNDLIVDPEQLWIDQIFKNDNILWDRIATVLDRHTDWYMIDMINLEKSVYLPTFSPWVASSYYIDKSDNFTKPGYAMGLAGDGHRHWMFIQRVHKDNWLKASMIKLQEEDEEETLPKIDLYNTWFDETTFSRSSLGAAERGWDRFGTVSPEELGDILYLYHSKDLTIY